MTRGARTGTQAERAGARAATLFVIVAAAFGVAAGAAAGIGGYVFVYAEGASYLTDDPAACANCHVMRAHLDAWSKSSHRAVAVCNDCHAPRGLLRKYGVKAINGYNHSLAFVTGRFADPFHVTPLNRRVTEAACRTCHGEIVEAIDHAGSGAAEPISCVRCHADVGHDVQ